MSQRSSIKLQKIRDKRRLGPHPRLFSTLKVSKMFEKNQLEIEAILVTGGAGLWGRILFDRR